jgi:4-hydroxy-3-methylbut-2-enyl diphosphate reductase
MLKVKVAKSAGFCFGVKRAIELALKTASSRKNIFMLGDIVHNESVVKGIAAAGIKKIARLGPGRKKTLVMRAHGASKKTFSKAICLGYKIIDATCPMVKEIHYLAEKMEKEGLRIIIIGDERHEEVQGIIGQLKKRPLVISARNGIPLQAVKKIKRAGVVVQSTQNLQDTLAIVRVLKKHVPDLRFFNTICRPTRLKQEEIRSLARANAVMVIIGSKRSANTRRLYEIAKSLNKKTYWIATRKDLKKEWFKQAQSVGVSAGASTPATAIKEVVDYLKLGPPL